MVQPDILSRLSLAEENLLRPTRTSTSPKFMSHLQYGLRPTELLNRHDVLASRVVAHTTLFQSLRSAYS